MKRILLPVLILLAALSTNAQTLRRGDLLWIPGCTICPPTWPQLTVYTPALEVKEQWQLNPGAYGPILTAPDKTLVAGYELQRYTPAGDFIGSYPQPGLAISYDRSGALYASKQGDASVILRMTPLEVLDEIFLPVPVVHGDLAADQCTLHLR